MLVILIILLFLSCSDDSNKGFQMIWLIIIPIEIILIRWLYLHLQRTFGFGQAAFSRIRHCRSTRKMQSLNLQSERKLL